MKCLFILAALVAAASAQIAARLDSQEVRLNRMSSRIESLTNQLEGKAGATSKSAGSITKYNYQLNDAFGDGCTKDELPCGDGQCVNILQVCDGEKTCSNGKDEEVCDSPIAAGDSFRGTVVYDRCTSRKPKEIRLVINSFQRSDSFKTKAQTEASYILSADSAAEDTDAYLMSSGNYCFGCRLLYTNPPEKDSLALTCKFDQGDNDRCTGYIVRENTGEKCAKFFFVRE